MVHHGAKVSSILCHHVRLLLSCWLIAMSGLAGNVCCEERHQTVYLCRTTLTRATCMTTCAGTHVTFTNFGIKKASLFNELVAEHGVTSMVRDTSLVRRYETEAGRARLRDEMVELYHKRHSATVTGDTVGDPFKDTSGPSLNVLTKTMSMMALMLAPVYARFGETEGYDGFTRTPTIIAAGLAVVVGIVCYVLVAYFRRSNARKHEAAVRAKKEADARLAAMAVAEGRSTGAHDHHHVGEESAGGHASDVTPLIAEP